MLADELQKAKALADELQFGFGVKRKEGEKRRRTTASKSDEEARKVLLPIYSLQLYLFF